MNKAFEKILERLRRKVHNYYPSIDHYCLSEHAVKMSDIEQIVKEVEEEYKGGWIPCSERLPEDREWYLAVFEEVDTGFIGLPYIAHYLMGAKTKFTTVDGWIIHNCTDREDVSSEYYKKLRCVAWQPLPQPYKESE